MTTFENHSAKKVGPGHWMLKNPKNGQFWCDVVVHTGNRAVTVWGDIDTCTFAYYDGTSGAEGAIGWVAGMSGGYMLEKARIGMGRAGDDCFTSYDHNLAAEDLEKYRSLDDGEERSQIVTDYIERVASEDDEAAWKKDFVTDTHAYDGWEIVSAIGRRPSARVVLAQAACARLYELLEADKVSL